MEMRAVIEGAGLDAPSPEVGESRRAQIRGRASRLVVSGVGPLAAAYAAGRLAGEGALAPERCKGVFCFGIAGTYDAARAPLGSVVLATREIWPEYGLAAEGGVDAAALGFPLAGKKNDTDPPPVWNALDLDPVGALAAMSLWDPENSPRTGNNPLFAKGPSITVAGVSGTLGRAAALAAGYAALTENMEGFPLALAAREAHLPFAEARAISNRAGNTAKSAWDIPLALASLSRTVTLLFAD